jgi:hypothetical protein
VKAAERHGDAAAVWALLYYVLTAAGLRIVGIPFIGLNAGQAITSHLLGYGRLEQFYTLDIMACHVWEFVGMRLMQ